MTKKPKRKAAAPEWFRDGSQTAFGRGGGMRNDLRNQSRTVLITVTASEPLSEQTAELLVRLLNGKHK
jgi:hypothetical protein